MNVVASANYGIRFAVSKMMSWRHMSVRLEHIASRRLANRRVTIDSSPVPFSIFSLACIFLVQLGGGGVIVSYGSEPPVNAAQADRNEPAEIAARAVELDHKGDHRMH